MTCEMRASRGVGCMGLNKGIPTCIARCRAGGWWEQTTCTARYCRKTFVVISRTGLQNVIWCATCLLKLCLVRRNGSTRSAGVDTAIDWAQRVQRIAATPVGIGAPLVAFVVVDDMHSSQPSIRGRRGSTKKSKSAATIGMVPPTIAVPH